jgi:hypothetical protein
MKEFGVQSPEIVMEHWTYDDVQEAIGYLDAIETAQANYTPEKS